VIGAPPVNHARRSAAAGSGEGGAPSPLSLIFANKNGTS
jgi:hypothetical protein